MPANFEIKSDNAGNFRQFRKGKSKRCLRNEEPPKYHDALQMAVFIVGTNNNNDNNHCNTISTDRNSSSLTNMRTSNEASDDGHSGESSTRDSTVQGIPPPIYRNVAGGSNRDL